MCVCVCVRERERERERGGGREGGRERACVRAFFLDREGIKVFASTALVVGVQRIVHQTGCSNCLTGFCEQLSRHYRSHTGLKNV